MLEDSRSRIGICSVGVSSEIGGEPSLMGGGVFCVREFSERYDSCPVVLFVVGGGSEELFEYLVDSFGEDGSDWNECRVAVAVDFQNREVESAPQSQRIVGPHVFEDTETKR